jgi:hypothetical protein
MKNLFRLGMVAFIAISIVSCSKSAMDLELNEPKTTQNEETSKSNPIVSTSKLGDPTPRIYDFITQPIELSLGDTRTAILYAGVGEVAVFYVIIPNDYTEESIQNAGFTLFDDVTGDPIKRYDMEFMDNAANYSLQVPEQLINHTYMFAVVNLEDLRDPDGTVYSPTPKPVSLNASIRTDNGILSLDLRHAFAYIQ